MLGTFDCLLMTRFCICSYILSNCIHSNCNLPLSRSVESEETGSTAPGSEENMDTVTSQVLSS